MKMICDVPDEVIKCIKDGMWCGSHIAEKMITNGIPLSSMEEPCEDAISRQAVLKIIDGWYEQNRDTDNIEDLIVLITYMDYINPQKPIFPSAGIDCEDCPAYEPKTGHSSSEGATNKDIFKAIFGYEPATDSVVCNKEDWCGASEPCNYCLNNSNSIGREEDWWNAPYKAEGSEKE